MNIRRSVKNVICNYTPAETKVREATSNDPWGPSSTLMAELADMSYNNTQIVEIMNQLWKRLNDDGKNWRHVYKALVVMEYITKSGSDKVAAICLNRISTITTLASFQHVDADGKDQGLNVREKSKNLVALLQDPERMKSERQRALNAKSRLAECHNRTLSTLPSQSAHSRSSTDLNRADRNLSRQDDSLSTDGRFASPALASLVPSSEDEEQRHLNLAISLSKQAAEQDRLNKMSDEERLQFALAESTKGNAFPTQVYDSPQIICDVYSSPHDAWGTTQPREESVIYTSLEQITTPSAPCGYSDPFDSSKWSIASSGDGTYANIAQLQTTAVRTSDTKSASTDPFAAAAFQRGLLVTTPPGSSGMEDLYSVAIPPSCKSSFASPPGSFDIFSSHDPFDANPIMTMTSDPGLNNAPSLKQDEDTCNMGAKSETQIFLEKNAALIDLDSFSKPSAALQGSSNPFATTNTTAYKTNNPFSAEKPKTKTINELKAEQLAVGPSKQVADPFGLPVSTVGPPRQVADPFGLPVSTVGPPRQVADPFGLPVSTVGPPRQVADPFGLPVSTVGPPKQVADPFSPNSLANSFDRGNPFGF